MFVVSNRNIILPGPNGEKFAMPKGFMGTVPAWAEGSAYLKALEADGKVIVSAGSRDKDIDAAGKRRGRGRRGGSSQQDDGSQQGADGRQDDDPGGAPEAEDGP